MRFSCITSIDEGRDHGRTTGWDKSGGPIGS